MIATVYLVGAGPGDPELLTRKGLRLIRQADVILYDHLVNDSLLAEARREAWLVYVGKESGRRHRGQERINELMISNAIRGRTVVRLKGGDPFVFGRGGEEAMALAHEHIPFEIVPGVSSAVAAPAYAGIPVTQRGMSSSFAVVAGHEDPGKAKSAVDWGAVSRAVDTLVILMGLSRLRPITERLLDAGRPPETPAAVIRWGTRREQVTITGTLGNIARQVESARLEPPAVIVIGKVASLGNELEWFRFAQTQCADHGHPSPPHPRYGAATSPA